MSDYDSHFKLANQFYERKQYQKAIEQYKLALKYCPNDNICYYNMGNAYKAISKLNESLDCFNKAININPENSSAFNNKGTVLKLMKKNNEAIDAFDQAIKLNPRNSAFYNNKGNALFEMLNYDKAIEEYKLAIKLNPNDGAAYNNMGNALNSIGWNSDAIEAYTKAIEINPSNSLFLSNRGKVYLDLNETQKGISDLNSANCLLEQSGKDELSKSNVKFIKGTIRALVQFEGSIINFDNLAKSKKANGKKFENIIEEMNEIKELRSTEIKNLKFDGTSHENILVEIQKLNDKVLHLTSELENLKDENMKMKQEMNLASRRLSNLEEQFSNCLLNYECILTKTFEEEDPINFKLLKDYFFGFTSTFSNLFTSSSVIEVGDTQLDTGNITTSLASFLISIIPVVGDVFEAGFSTISEFLEKQAIISESKRILMIRPDIVLFSQLVGESAIEAIKINKKNILSTTEKSLKPKIQTIYGEIYYCFKDTASALNKMLYGELYDTPQKQLGNMDANKIIEEYLSDQAITIEDWKTFISLLSKQGRERKSISSSNKLSKRKEEAKTKKQQTINCCNIF